MGRPAVGAALAALVCASSSGIDWHPSWQTAMKAASKSRKVVYVFVYLPGRATCAQMDQKSLRDPEVVKAMASFEAAPVDASTPEGGKFVEVYKLPWIRDPQRGIKLAVVPNHLFFAPDGKELHRQVGYIPPIAFRALLQRVLKLRELTDAVKRSPKDPKLQAQLGHLHLELNHEDEGRRHLELAIALDPDNRAGAAERARLDLAILTVKRDPELGASRLQAWLDSYPRSPLRMEAEFYLATAYAAAGRIQQADAVLQKFRNAKPGTPEAESEWGARARALYKSLHSSEPIGGR
ncbi:MAG: hypothetical protein H5T86_07525 [Armatimonadetes bacterium]|nr:hypothetical protein [Armatimonadota bacterium]